MKTSRKFYFIKYIQRKTTTHTDWVTVELLRISSLLCKRVCCFAYKWLELVRSEIEKCLQDCPTIDEEKVSRFDAVTWMKSSSTGTANRPLFVTSFRYKNPFCSMFNVRYKVYGKIRNVDHVFLVYICQSRDSFRSEVVSGQRLIWVC